MIAAAFLLAAAAGAGPADAAADLFVSDCAACHTIGGGDLDGPDLEPATHRSEADVRKAVENMSENVVPMTSGQIDGMVALLRSRDLAARLDAARKRSAEAASAAPVTGSADDGASLFRGSTAFANRGVPCAACHAFAGAGGSLAVPLDGAAARLGLPGLAGAASSPIWPAMKAAYGARPVTKQEAANLAAYLAGAGRDAGAAVPYEPPVFRAALALVIALAAFLAFALRRRDGGARAALARSAKRRATP